jgi:hypothetical protein
VLVNERAHANRRGCFEQRERSGDVRIDKRLRSMRGDVRRTASPYATHRDVAHCPFDTAARSVIDRR